jgi:hypothetical protein
MPPTRVLIQLDCDPQPSTFDAIVAVDAGAEVLLRHGGVTPDAAVPLVHGAMFTRGGGDLSSTAIFIGGSDVAAAEAVYERVRSTFFGPVRVGVLLDPSGANTTAAAAVVAAARHVPLDGASAAGTLASRSRERAAAACARIAAQVPHAKLVPVESGVGVPRGSPLGVAVEGADVIVSAGAAGAVLLDAAGRSLAGRARVLIDLNAVPPAGIDGIEASDKARRVEAAVVYGALGVGGTKMKIHRAAIGRIFAANDVCLDAEELLAIGESL